MTSGTDPHSFYHLGGGCSLTGRACRGTACFVARHLNPERWTAAEQQQPRIHCLGQCFAAPAVGGDPVFPKVGIRCGQGIVLNRVAEGGASTLADYRAKGGYAAYERAVSMTPGEIVDAVEASGLRGRGGAGFPTGRKWRDVARQPAGVKFIIANADEGDPGAYIDRFLMERDPHALIEGMLIAGQAVGAGKGIIYLRQEYPDARKVLEGALMEARAAGLLGTDAGQPGAGFEIGLFVGQGSYVCGEETALINSLAGRRPVAVARPPYPTVHGLSGRPTLVNNVETLVNIPWIVSHGADAYAALGFSRSRGTKVVSLNSLFNQPGLYEIEFGVPVRHLVEEIGGGLRDGPPRGVIIGGPLAGIIPPHLLDTPFAFDELHAIGAGVGHGGVIAFDAHTPIAALVHQVFSFAAFESCGQCTPCRLGSRRVEQMLENVRDGRVAGHWNAGELAEIVAALRRTSLCGLGTGLGEFAESALRYYPEELEACFR